MAKFLVILFILSIFLTILPVMAEDNPSYYVSLYPGSYCYYPGEKTSLSISVYYYYLKEKGNINEKLKLDIFELPSSSVITDYDKYFSGKKPLKTIEKKIVLKNDYDYYWESYFTMDLPELTPGFYYIKGLTKKAESYCILKVSNLGLSVKPSQDEIFFFLQDRKDGSPIKDVEVKLLKNDKEIKAIKSDENGSGTFSIKDVKDITEGDYVYIAAKKDRNLAQSSVTAYKIPETIKGYIYTDRPIYRPEQKIYIKGILRYEKKEELSYAKDSEISLVIKDPAGAEVYSNKVKTDEYGTLSDRFTLGKEPPLGTYYIYCTDKEGRQSTGNFRVEEYRKPEFEIKLKGDKENYIQGENLKIDMAVNYYFGAPVPDTDYTYEIRRNYYYPYICKYWWQDCIMPYYSNYGNTIIHTGSGKTDKDGKSVITFKTEKLDYDSNYSVYVKMTDKSRREVTSSTTSLVTKGAFYITLNTDPYFCKEKEKINIKLEAKDYSQKPVKTEGQYIIKYESYDKKKKAYNWEEIKKGTVKTDEKGISYFDFSPEKTGYYEVTCNTIDEKENKITASTSFYCSSEEGWYPWYRFTNVEIIPDKEYYKIGEEANILIVCPFEKAKGLATIEGDGILYREILDFKNKTSVIKTKITDKYCPNFFVTVSFYQDGNYHYYNKKIICPREDKFLTVEIKSDKEKYKPRDNAKFTIQTKDYKNNPVTAQITMGVADESVYAVASDTTPNIQKFFYGTKNNYIYTYNSEGLQYGGPYYYNYDYYGPMKSYSLADGAPPPPAPPPSMEGAMTQAEAAAVMVQPDFIRSFFPDTAYFNPSIITDETGTAVVTVPLPDTLTTWRATTKGISKETDVGETTEKIIVTKNLLARLITPRFLTERDETVITTVVHNYLSSKKIVHLKLEIKGNVELLSPSEAKIEIPPDGSVPFDWKVKAKMTGDSVFTLTALTDEESDAVELTVPILGHGTEKYVAFSGSTKDKAEGELTLPGDGTKESAKCIIILDPSLASSVFSSLDYLVGYPYGCVEQTMSRFLPNVIVSKTLGELDIYNEKINKDLPDMVDKGFKRLYNYHHSDGGWGWWENDESHPFMTAYVVYGLSLARDAGFNVEKDKIESGIKWLKDNYDKEKEIDTKAYMAFAATVAGSDTKEWLPGLYKKQEKLNNYSRAVLALSLKKSGLVKEAEEIASILEKNAETTGTTAYWPGKSFSHGWTDNQIETTAYCLKAIVAIKPDSQLIPKIIRFLTGCKQSNYWYSTKDTAAVVMAFTDYIKISKEMNPDFTADVYFNGTKFESSNFTKDDVGKEGKKIEIPYEKGLLAGKNNIKIEINGKGVLYYAAYLKYFTKGEDIKSEDSGISVKRAYYLVKKDKDGKEEKVKLGSNGRIEVNCQDIIEVELQVFGPANYEYVIIEDPKPAGCEVEEEKGEGYYDWTYWYCHKEIRDEKVAFFSTYFTGKQVISYRLRAETPGIFHTMPAKSFLMYTPEIGGNSSEIIVDIKDNGERKIE